jgi:hypothetical protein
MPGFDGTGPAGAGPMSGGGRGWCAVPLTRGQWPARPAGCWGRGHRWMYHATGLPGWMRFGADVSATTPPAPDERAMLQAQADRLRAELDAITARLAALDLPQPE